MHPAVDAQGPSSVVGSAPLRARTALRPGKWVAGQPEALQSGPEQLTVRGHHSETVGGSRNTEEEPVNSNVASFSAMGRAPGGGW